MGTFCFERNSYLTHFLNHQNFDDDEKLFNFVRQHPQFHYSAIINNEDFAKKYTSEGWLGRKILAIPAGIYHGCVEVIATLSISLIGIPFVAVAGEKDEGFRHCKFILFYCIRHIQISFEHFASLFNDQYGLYQTQEGHFYLTCYKCWRAQKAVISLNEEGHGIIFG